MSGGLQKALDIVRDPGIITGLRTAEEARAWIEESLAAAQGADLLEAFPWTLSMDDAPDDGTVIIAMARWEGATAGFPRFVSFKDGAWREAGRTAMPPLVCWAWIPREVLGEWPAEPRPAPAMIDSDCIHPACGCGDGPCRAIHEDGKAPT